MKPLFPKGQAGYTLLELMVAMGISVAVIGFIGITYTANVKRYVHSRQKSQTQAGARLSLDFISGELRDAGYVVAWDPTPDAPPFGINQPITGAIPDPQTETITIRYALAPLTAASPTAAALTGPPTGINGTTIPVAPLPFSIPANGLIVLYSPPATANVRRVASAAGIGATSVTLLTPPSSTSAFKAGDLLVLVQENAFWVEGGDLMMRTGGANLKLAPNIEDLQVALIDKDEKVTGDTGSTAFAGMTTAQLMETRAVRLSLTSRSKIPVPDMAAAPPPSLEDHDRSGETADHFLRGVEETTVYLRNFGALTQ